MKQAVVLILISFVLGFNCARSPKESISFDDPRVVLKYKDYEYTLGELNRRLKRAYFRNAQEEFETKLASMGPALQELLYIEGAEEAGVFPQIDSAV